LRNLAEFVDLQQLAKLVRASVDSSLTSQELEAKRLFLEAMDRLDSGEAIESIDIPAH